MEAFGTRATVNISLGAAKGIFQEAKRHIRYVIIYKKNVDKFEEKLQMLVAKRRRMQSEVDAAARNMEKIDPDVQLWCDRVDQAIEEEDKKVKDLEENAKSKCFIGLCPNIKSRYQLSRKAEQGATAMDGLLQHGEFNRVSYPLFPVPTPHPVPPPRPVHTPHLIRLPPPTAPPLMPAPTMPVAATAPKVFVAFKSREKIFNDIMEALGDATVGIIGVSGMVGVGKTALVEEVALQVIKYNLFDVVIIGVVNQTPDIQKIQNQIADSLGLKFEEQSTPGRAHCLCERLKKEEKMLIVLDDLWARLDLKEVGIPVGDEPKGCKILLTSRDHNVLYGMDAQKHFAINVLEEKEALDLLKKMAGDEVENFAQLRSIAIEVAKQCAGLPVAITTVAWALRYKDLFAWRDALRKLQYPAAAFQETELIPIQGYEAFESRNATLEMIMKALKHPDFKIIGVYGMAGVGKTTLVKEVVRKAGEESLFDVVSVTTVSRNPNIKEIQGKIAEALDLKFDEESVLGRAMRLQQWFKKEDKRVLLVLDDVWQRLDLEEVGIAFEGYQNIGSEEDLGPMMQNVSGNAFRKFSGVRLKILLTSTNEEVLVHMKSGCNFEVQVLTDEEAKVWFKKILGDRAWQLPYKQIVSGVVKNCAGFPVAISAIAIAFRTPVFRILVDALQKQRMPMPTKDEDLKSVYSTIELSYGLLEKPELQSLLQLCALLPQGAEIHMSDLLRYNLALKIARDVSKLEEARKSVNRLKKAGLLQSSDNDELVKMHDIVRDVSIWIASKDKRMFVIEDEVHMDELLQQGLLKNCTAISMPYSDIHELPCKLECPRIKLLVLLNKNPFLKVSDTFFQETEELLVLDLTGINFPSLPSSFTSLRNLQRLCFNECNLNDIALIGNLKQLNTLRIHSSDIQELPWEIGKLTQLRSLDLSNCSKLKVILPNILSGLSNLEELFMRNSFDQWGFEGNAGLSELKPLSRLTALEVHIRYIQAMPSELFRKAG